MRPPQVPIKKTALVLFTLWTLTQNLHINVLQLLAEFLVTRYSEKKPAPFRTMNNSQGEIKAEQKDQSRFFCPGLYKFPSRMVLLLPF